MRRLRSRSPIRQPNVPIDRGDAVGVNRRGVGDPADVAVRPSLGLSIYDPIGEIMLAEQWIN